MAQKKIYRYLIITVMATFFTVLLALNTLAAPAGGIGQIIGLEDGVTYEAKPVTINAAGTGYKMGEAITLDETGNKNLAGLYVVSTDGFTTWSDLIYVQGSLEGRQKLGTFAEGTTINATRDRASATDVFKVGFYYGASYGSESSGNVGAVFQTDYVFSSAYWKGNSSPYGYYDPWPTPTGLQAALDAEATNDETYTGPSSATIKSQVKAMLESYSLNYAYTSDEIIPVDELLTMKIGLSKRGNYDNFKISPVTSKVVFLVMDENGNVTEHTWTGASKALTFYASTIIEETINVQSIDTLPDEGWIVAFKYYPVGYISADAITVGSTGRGTGNEGRRIYDFNLRVGYDESVDSMADYYVIAKPKAAAPTGVKYDATTKTLSGLTAGTSYTLAPYTVEGAGAGTTFTAEGTTYTPATALTAGLWGVSVNASETNTASDPYIIYVEGLYKDRADLGTETDGVINTTRDRNGAEWKSGYYFGVNKKGYAVANKFCNAYAFNGSKTTSYFGAEFIPTAKALYDAVTAETNNDTSYTGKSSLEIKTQVKTILENYYVSYAYTSDEIIPVDELLTVKFGRGKIGALTLFVLPEITGKAIFYVMDETGKVTPYTWTGTSKAISTSGAMAYDEINMQTVLPDKGWVVGFKYYPVGTVNANDITYAEGAVASTSDRVYEFTFELGSSYDGFYVISKPKAKTPTSVTYDTKTKTLSGLTAGASYTLAPYTVMGVGTSQTITAQSETATVELTAGLWGINVNDGDAYVASDLYVFYVEGDEDARKSLGTETDGVINATRDRNGVEWKEGYFFGVNKIGYSTKNKFCTAYAFNGSKTTSYFGAEFIPTAKALYDAVTAETNNDTTYTGKSSLEIKTQVKTILENYYVSYAYTSDEIIPVDELLTVKFGRGKIGALTLFVLPEITGKAIFYVMDETGEVTPYTWTGTSKAISADGDMAYDEINMQTVLPDKGWVVGFKYYPVGTVNANDITYAEGAVASTSDRVYEFTLELGSSYDGYYVIKEEPKLEVTGASLLLDGAIGIKLYMSYAENVTAISLTNIDEYTKTAPTVTMADGVATAVFYVNPKDALDFTVTGDLVYTLNGEDKTIENAFKDLSVIGYVEDLKKKADAGDADALAAKALVEALEVYYTQANIYFDNDAEAVAVSLTDDEMIAIAGMTNPTRTGTMPTGLEFYSSSLILEETTSIRHYFKVTGNTSGTPVATVNGEEALVDIANSTEDLYLYVEVSDIAADELKTATVVTISDGTYTATITFSALDYVKLTYNDETNAKLMNVSRALYKYSVAADAYLTTPQA